MRKMFVAGLAVQCSVMDRLLSGWTVGERLVKGNLVTTFNLPTPDAVHQPRRFRRAAWLAGVSAALLVTALLAPGSAAPFKGVKGTPQPEAKTFKIGNASSDGTTAIEPDGTIVTAFDIPHNKAQGELDVCVIKRGADKCSSTVKLPPVSSQDDDFGAPQVYAESDDDITVLQGTCCDNDPAGSDLIWQSTNGGKSFDTPARVGTITPDFSAVVGGQLLWTDGDTGSVQITGVPLTTTATPVSPPAIATLSHSDAYEIGIGQYDKGALIAWTHPTTSSDEVETSFAPSGSDFTDASDYHSAGNFSGEELESVSGDAMVSVQSKGKGYVLLRTFGKSGWSAPHEIPGTKGVGTLSNYVVDENPSGHIDVFSDDSKYSYDLTEFITNNDGKSWSTPLSLYNAIDGGIDFASLDANGTGIVLGTGGSKALAYPILQVVKVVLAASAKDVKTGKTVKLSGGAEPPFKNDTVELQQKRGGLWYDVASTKESSSGKFSFKIKDSKAETQTLRAVTGDRAGYLEYGYSKSVNVTFYKPAHH